MPLQRINLKPQRMLGAGLEVVLSFSCEGEPKVEWSHITGLKQVALLFGHEYDAHATIESSSSIPAQLPGCDNPRRYHVRMAVYTVDVVGIGLGFGPLGTGVLGKRYPAIGEFFIGETDTICCDSPSPPPPRRRWWYMPHRREILGHRKQRDVGLAIASATILALLSVQIYRLAVEPPDFANDPLGAFAAISGPLTAFIGTFFLIQMRLRKSRSEEHAVTRW